MSNDEELVLNMLGYAHALYYSVLDQIDALGDNTDPIPDRDVFARYADETDEPELLLALLDGKDIETILWDRYPMGCS